MSPTEIRVSSEWLSLREPADAAARSRELAGQLGPARPAAGSWVIHDLGCGTGSMARWLAPQLRGPQRWVLHDRDAGLLALAASHAYGRAGDGSAVTVHTQRSDITRLGPGDLGQASLITASALLDMLTEEELRGLVGLCAGAGCPALLTLSVVGNVTLTPSDPLDRSLAAAFDAHQRRVTDRGRLLGPDAAGFAAEAFSETGAEVRVRPSPWRLGAGQAELMAQWLTGWVGAACEQEPGLAAEADAYTRRRLSQAGAGRLTATVDHVDVLALPRSSAS